MNLQVKERPFSNLPFSNLFRQFIDGFTGLENFFTVDPANIDQIAARAQRVDYKGDRGELVDILRRFNEPFDLDQAAQQNIESLAADETITVTTGQQLTVLGGPLYTVFKTISVIVYARRLEARLGKKVVPVFWLADEDHDYEEISSLCLPTQKGLTSAVLPKGEHPGLPVADLMLEEESFAPFIDRVKELLPETEFSGELWTLLNKSYSAGRSFRDAFACFLSGIFSKHGLFFAGSNTKDFKSFVKPVLRAAVEKSEEIGNALEAQSSKIEKVFHRQALSGPSTLFYLDPEYGRSRIKKEDGRWRDASGREFSYQELLEIAEDYPERFSPNVFLRPVLQDYLLPNVAYIGGPGEIAYYGQMRDLYPVFGMEMPAILPRLSGSLIEPFVAKHGPNLPFEFWEYQARIEDIEQDYVRRSSRDDLDAMFNEWKEGAAGFAELRIGKIAKLDPTLKGAAERVQQQYGNELMKLKGKVMRAIKQRDETQVKRLGRIQNSLFPEGKLQERALPAVYAMNKYGCDIWDRILIAVEDLDFSSHKLFYL